MRMVRSVRDLAVPHLSHFYVLPLWVVVSGAGDFLLELGVRSFGVGRSIGHFFFEILFPVEITASIFIKQGAFSGFHQYFRIWL